MRAREWIAGVVLALGPAVAAAQPPDAVVVDEARREITSDPPPTSWPYGGWWANLSAEFGWTSPRSWPEVRLRPVDLVGQRISNFVLPKNDTRYGLQMGFGLQAGRWFGEDQHFALDFGFLIFPGATRGINGYTTGTLVYFPNGPEQSAPIFVRFPEAFADFAMPVPATATDFFTTLDLSLRAGGRLTDSLRVDVLFGYRFAYLEDQMYLGTENKNNTSTDQYGNQTANDVYKSNRLTVENAFHGGQVGLEAGFNSRMFTVTGAAKLAYGGLTTKTNASGVFQFPVEPLRTGDTRAAFLPSFNGRFGVRITDGASVYVGYNFLYLDHVSRFSDALAPGAGPMPGSPFWVQSVSLGFDLRF